MKKEFGVRGAKVQRKRLRDAQA